MKIGSPEFETSGRWLRLTRVAEAYEDYADLENPPQVIESMKQRRPRVDLFSFCQRLPQIQPLYDYPLEWDNVAAIPISTHKAWLESAVHPTVRTKLRKAQKLGVSVDLMPLDDRLLEGLSGIFNEAPVRQGRPYMHYGKTLEQIRVEWSVDMHFSQFVGATFNGELIGFVKLSFTDRYAEMSGTVCKLAHRDKPAMSALVSRCVQFCEERGIPYLCYGKYVYGRKGEDSLTDFKRHNGFKRFDVPRYYIPLTLRGRLALRWGVHHGLKNLLPQSLVRKLIDYRAMYYRWRLASAQ